MISAEAASFAIEIAKLSEGAQRSFLDNLKSTGIFSDEEIEALLITVGYFRLQMYPDLARAIKKSLAYSMYEEIKKGQ